MLQCRTTQTELRNAKQYLANSSEAYIITLIAIGHQTALKPDAKFTVLTVSPEGLEKANEINRGIPESK